MKIGQDPIRQTVLDKIRAVMARQNPVSVGIARGLIPVHRAIHVSAKNHRDAIVLVVHIAPGPVLECRLHGHHHTKSLSSPVIAEIGRGRDLRVDLDRHHDVAALECPVVVRIAPGLVPLLRAIRTSVTNRRDVVVIVLVVLIAPGPVLAVYVHRHLRTTVSRSPVTRFSFDLFASRSNSQ